MNPSNLFFPFNAKFHKRTTLTYIHPKYADCHQNDNSTGSTLIAPLNPAHILAGWV